MKRALLVALACFAHLSCLAQNQKFSIAYSKGLRGGSTPTTATLTNQDAVTPSRATSLTNYFLDSTKLDFKCVYNGCQNRAMVMSLYLQKKGIKHYKIWNFDPFKIAIFNRQDALEVNDPLNLLGTQIYWDFHVAVALLVKNTAKAQPDTVILDPAFSRRPLTPKEWLAIQNSPTSYYTFLDPIWYNYVTLTDGTSFPCKEDSIPKVLTLPTCFPQIITGDFYSFGPGNERLIVEELATNEQATRAAVEIVYKIKVTDPRRASLASVVANYNGFKSMLQGSGPLDTQNPFYSYISSYRKAYTNSVAYWTTELQNLR